MTFLQESNKQNPKVSVITPTYNRLSMLEEALGSVFSQEFDGVIEIIVVDDNSQDGTSEIIAQKYPSVHIISLKQNVGAPAARNRAILQARGDYIAFLDSDDLWKPNYLKTQLVAFEGKEKCFCVSGIVAWDTVTEQETILLQRPYLEKYSSPFHHLLVEGSFIFTPSSVIFPKQVLDEVGLFDETHRFGEDTDLYMRCLLAGYYPIFTELPVALRRRHDRGQLTDAGNLEIMRKARLARADKFHSLIKKRTAIPSIEHIYAEIDTYFASECFRKKYYLKWIILSIESAKKISFGYALSNMINDIRCLLTIGTRLRNIRSYFQSNFHFHCKELN